MKDGNVLAVLLQKPELKSLKVLTSNGACQTKLGPTIWGLTGHIYQDAKTVTGVLSSCILLFFGGPTCHAPCYSLVHVQYRMNSSKF